MITGFFSRHSSAVWPSSASFVTLDDDIGLRMQTMDAAGRWAKHDVSFDKVGALSMSI